jgi:hypothetical protein
MCVEGMYVMGQVLLTCDLSLLYCQLFKECSLPSNAMEVKEMLRACVPVSKLGGSIELVIPRHLLL